MVVVDAHVLLAVGVGFRFCPCTVLVVVRVILAGLTFLPYAPSIKQIINKRRSKALTLGDDGSSVDFGLTGAGFKDWHRRMATNRADRIGGWEWKCKNARNQPHAPYGAVHGRGVQKEVSYTSIMKRGLENTEERAVENQEKATPKCNKEVDKLVKLSQREMIAIPDSATIVLGNVKDLGFIQNAERVLLKGGFQNVEVSYIGGSWIWIEFDNRKACTRFKQSEELLSYFREVQNLSRQFLVDEKIVWIEISRMPLGAWSVEGFKKVAENWGEVVFSDSDQGGVCNGRVCVRTERRKRIQGQVVVELEGVKHWVDVKELGAWEDSNSDEGHFGMEHADDGEEGEILMDEPRNVSVPMEEGRVEDVSSEEEIRSGKKKWGDEVELGMAVLQDIGSSAVKGNSLAHKGDSSAATPSRPLSFSHQPATSPLQDSKGAEVDQNAGRECAQLPTAASSFSLGSKGNELVELLNGMGANNNIEGVVQKSPVTLVDLFELRLMWGNFTFDFAVSSVRVFPEITCFGLPNTISDHRPICLKETVVDFGPHPFRFFNSWMEEVSFAAVLNKSWSLSVESVEDGAAIRLKNKFKRLKEDLKRWWKEISKDRDSQRKHFDMRMVEIDVIIDQGNVSDEVLLERCRLRAHLQQFENKERLDMAQKAKVKWSVEGDENSKFFHGVLKRRRMVVAIKGVKVDGVWAQDVAVVKNKFFSHFREKFMMFHNIRLNNPSPRFQQISNEQGEDLAGMVTEEEIRAAVYWEVFKGDIVDFVKDFFSGAFIPSGCNASFITLIPKLPNPLGINNYRPISLIRIQYKIVAKILALQLTKVVDSVVGDEQTAFVKGRQILDGPLMVNELVNWCVHVALEDAISAGLYTPVSVGSEELKISHLLYADDELFVGEWSKENVEFSGVYVALLLYGVGFKNKFDEIEPLWGWGGLWRGGDVGEYSWVSCRVEKDRKLAWVSWDQVMARKDNGGLEIGSLVSFNMALILKWKWRFFNSQHLLCVRLIKALYGPNGGFFQRCKPAVGTSPWSRINAVEVKMQAVGVVPQNSLRRRVAALESDRQCLVSDRKVEGVWRWSWTRQVVGGRSFDELSRLLVLLGDFSCVDEPDKWVWDISSDGSFSVAETRKWIDDLVLPQGLVKTRWCKFIPGKMNIFVWRLLLDRLPTRASLSSRGIEINSIMCSICGAELEQIEHLFCLCEFAKCVWELLFRWLQIPSFGAVHPREFFQKMDECMLNVKQKIVVEVVICTGLWIIWRFRNDVVHGGRKMRKNVIFDLIRDYAFVWFCNRQRKTHVTLRRLHGCNNESGTWNCSGKSETRRPSPMTTSGVKVLGIETLLGAETNADTSMRQIPFGAWESRSIFPEFDGRVQPDDFIDWLSMVEWIFDLKDIPDNYKVKLVAIELRKYASLWWNNTKRKRVQEGRWKVETWQKMKKLLCEKFLPVNHRQESFLEYHSVSQWTSSVEDFIVEFDRLPMRCGAEEPEEQIIARFWGALHPEISNVVQLQSY
ncbi:hypothetical protein LXL04_008050 [Taraxacum kok-saghyz]